MENEWEKWTDSVGMEWKDVDENINQKRAGLGILISGKTNFSTKITRNK